MGLEDRELWYERKLPKSVQLYNRPTTAAEKEAVKGMFTPNPNVFHTEAWYKWEQSIGRIARTDAERRAGLERINPYRVDYGSQLDPLLFRGGNTGTGGVYKQSQAFNSLSLGEQQQVEAAWLNMKQKNFGLNWWEVNKWQSDDGVWHRQLGAPLAMSFWNIEQDGEDWGWNDIMIGELQTRLTEDVPDADLGPDGIEEPWNPFGPGGGGSRGPVYVEPMRSVIEDTVRAMLTSLTGDEPDARVQELTDEYLKADKARWKIGQSGGVDIVPNQVVLELIRGQDDYKRIHKLRAESDSETGWIAGRNQRLQQLGLGSADADERAVFLAQTGTNLNDIDTGAFAFSKGMKDITLMGKIKKAASLVAGQL